MVGVGAVPNTKLFVDQLKMERGGIVVDGTFKSSNPDVYAIGDVASFPLKMYGGRMTRMEHVAHARQSAAHAVQVRDGTKQKLPAEQARFCLSCTFLRLAFYSSNIYYVLPNKAPACLVERKPSSFTVAASFLASFSCTSDARSHRWMRLIPFRCFWI